MNRNLILFVSLIGLSTHLFAQDPPSGDPSIIIPGSEIKEIFNQGKGFLEGPTMSENEMLYVCDIGRGYQTGHIWKIDPSTGESSVFLSPSGKANGMLIDTQNRLVIAQAAQQGGRRVIRIDLSTRLSEILTAIYSDLPYNAPNDLIIDDKGRIYFTDPSYSRFLTYEPIYQPVQGVYRIDPDGSVLRIIANAMTPNGIAVSPDQKTLYVASTDAGSSTFTVPEGLPTHRAPWTLFAYDLQEDGSAKNRRSLIEGVTDGMTVDSGGNLYLARIYEKRIGIYSPEGKEIGTIPLPGGPTNVAFGVGSYKNTLFITQGVKVFSIKVKKQGIQW